MRRGTWRRRLRHKPATAPPAPPAAAAAAAALAAARARLTRPASWPAGRPAFRPPVRPVLGRGPWGVAPGVALTRRPAFPGLYQSLDVPDSTLFAKLAAMQGRGQVAAFLGRGVRSNAGAGAEAAGGAGGAAGGAGAERAGAVGAGDDAVGAGDGGGSSGSAAAGGGAAAAGADFPDRPPATEAFQLPGAHSAAGGGGDVQALRRPFHRRVHFAGVLFSVVGASPGGGGGGGQITVLPTTRIFLAKQRRGGRPAGAVGGGGAARAAGAAGGAAFAGAAGGAAGAASAAPAEAASARDASPPPLGFPGGEAARAPAPGEAEAAAASPSEAGAAAVETPGLGGAPGPERSFGGGPPAFGGAFPRFAGAAAAAGAASAALASFPAVPFTPLTQDAAVRRPLPRLPPRTRVLAAELAALARALARDSPFHRRHFGAVLANFDFAAPAPLADLAAAMSFAPAPALQRVLAAPSLELRLELSLELLRRDWEAVALQNEIRAHLEQKVAREQRRALAQEQIQFLQRELDAAPERARLAAKYRASLEKARCALSTGSLESIEADISRLESLEAASPEYGLLKSYLDVVANVPWGIRAPETLDLEHAKRVFDARFHGLDDVRKRVLEYIAVRTLRARRGETGRAEEKALCLVGPPGVGKTSIARTIADALGRPYEKISLGGLADVAELRGHRRTYVGAFPGRLVQAVRRAKAMNPIILLDEIDKIGRDVRGDPYAVLLEVLDPVQNSSFQDFYLQCEVDLSSVTFICTANALDPSLIPPALIDRLEVIQLNSYLMNEKLAIAKEHFLPLLAKHAGLIEGSVAFDDEVLRLMVNDYAKEAGVRQFRQALETVHRKLALRTLTESGDGDLQRTFSVRALDLPELLGPPKFADGLFAGPRRAIPPGAAVGMAWTQQGGCLLLIEAVLSGPRRAAARHRSTTDSTFERVRLTGHLGTVMSESAQLAVSFARATLARIRRDGHARAVGDDFQSSEVHVHVPEGAVSKDGPSAGAAIACAVLSAATGVPVAGGAAVSGELTLTGRVLRVGGVREKVAAALRDGYQSIILPAGNRADFEALPAELRNQVRSAEFVSDFDALFALAFPSLRLLPASAPRAARDEDTKKEFMQQRLEDEAATPGMHEDREATEKVRAEKCES